jgi:Ca2+-transporting ATPase
LALAVEVPILPKQILWINIIQGGLLTFAYAFEPADQGVMKRSPNQIGSRGILNQQTKTLLFLSSFAFGTVSLCVYLLGQFGILNIPFEQLRTLIFAVLTIDVMVFSFALKDFNRPIWKINILSNKVLNIAVMLSFGAFLASMLIPGLRDFLSLSALPISLWLAIAAIACIDLGLVELAKLIARRRSPAVAPAKSLTLIKTDTI